MNDFQVDSTYVFKWVFYEAFHILSVTPVCHCGDRLKSEIRGSLQIRLT